MTDHSLRVFVALNLPVETIRAVAVVQDDLRRRAQRAGMQVGWVKPPNMHVTLKFLGQVPPESAYAARDRMAERLANRPALRLALRGLGAFPSASRPRVLWLGLHDEAGALTGLATDVDRWMGELGFEEETRPFAAHLTLGRVKQGATDILSELPEVDLGVCLAREVVLYRSVLQRTGAEYTPLVRVPLLDEPDAAP